MFMLEIMFFLSCHFFQIQTSEELSRIMGDMAIPDASGPSSKGDDLLELMDSAS